MRSEGRKDPNGRNTGAKSLIRGPISLISVLWRRKETVERVARDAVRDKEVEKLIVLSPTDFSKSLT